MQFAKTKVNFESLGQSIEPLGHCDNFFIAGHCRNFFELCHPRRSRKHYFYPKVGVHNFHNFTFFISMCISFEINWPFLSF